MVLGVWGGGGGGGGGFVRVSGRGGEKWKHVTSTWGQQHKKARVKHGYQTQIQQLIDYHGASQGKELKNGRHWGRGGGTMGGGGGGLQKKKGVVGGGELSKRKKKRKLWVKKKTL